MLLRALFWIGVVAVLMPHEPDLGLGRPHVQASVAPDADAASIDGVASADQDGGARGANVGCADYAKACAAGLSLLDNFQAIAVHSLAQVKAELEHEERHARRTTDG